MPNELSIYEILAKYGLRKPTEEWELRSLEEMLEEANFVMSTPEFHDVNIERWKKNEYGDWRPIEEALKEICARVLQLRRKGVPAHAYSGGINETVGRQERRHDDSVMGRWALTGIALALTQRPPKPRGRPRGTRREYPIEEWRRMREEGMSIREIARKTGFPKSTVYDALSGQK